MKATSFAPSLPSCFTTTISFPPFVFPEKLGARCTSVSVSARNRSSRIDGFNPPSSNTASPKATFRSGLEGDGIPASVPVRVAHELLQAGHHYLDVRTPEEFSAGHASGAINIPYMYRVGSGMTKNASFSKQVSTHFRKDAEIIIGCQSGKRSMMAAKDLLAAGFSTVTDIAGGYTAWTKNGLPTNP
ncbi:rhodanese-like domain-containing protein 15, chloroplastic [Rhodamnia argentea]|uniref:Rhodanese-like domain-containing protein 15, chloroplastic n=1 Tax=Rhodamnia argentea TaxID=178133 RepID=A0A8B8NPS7_9MYRT|nr:rhodanese-like domain-containing protein 15, chloroplastic [Rhodamnia argentea]